MFFFISNPLKFTVEDVTNIQLYPDADEPVNILNIKRGILSALIVPVMDDEENSFMVGISSQPKVATRKMLQKAGIITAQLSLAEEMEEPYIYT